MRSISATIRHVFDTECPSCDDVDLGNVATPFQAQPNQTEDQSKTAEPGFITAEYRK